MTRLAIVMLSAALPLAAAAAPAPCTIFVRAGHVPPQGVVADGSSPSAALARIRDAAQRVGNPGDVVCVGPGLYVERDITPRRSGIATHPIAFRGDASGASTGDPPGPVRVVAPPSGGSAPPAGFRLLGQQYIVIEGFTLEGYVDPAIQVRSAVGAPGNSTGVVIRGNEVRDVFRTGIDVSAEGPIAIEGNLVVGCGGSGISVQSCVDAPEFGSPESNDHPRCRGGPSAEVEPVIDGNRVGINASHGVFVRDANEPLIQSNVVYSNGASGITLRRADDTRVINNLIYRNGEQGLAVGTGDLAALRTVVANNTFYDNGSWGIEIGSGMVASPGAMVINNILSLNGNGNQGIGVQNETGVEPRSTCGYVAGFNVTTDAYGAKTPRNVYDSGANPLFDGHISGVDGILGGFRQGDLLVDGSADDRFTLSQPGSGRASPAVDLGYAAVDVVGLGGSTAADGRPDTGILDAGYHYDVAVGTVAEIPEPFMPLFVRPGGSDANDGKSPSAPLATIAAAANRARAGVSVVVAPGIYRECQLRPPPDQGRASFVADAEGRWTESAAGYVVVDAGCCTSDPIDGQCVPGLDGFNVPNSCAVVIDGFHVRGAADSGIVIQSGSHGAEVRNNVTFTNDRRGIGVVNADDVRIANNLVYDNVGGGIQVGGACRGGDCESVGSRRAVVESNTCYGNGVNGVLIGSGPGRSTHATVRYNILHVGRGERLPAGENGIQVGSNTTFQNHIEGYEAYFNINFEGRYGGFTPIPPSDRIDDPSFVNPAGPDGVLGGSGFADDSFHLAQRAAGQSSDSPALDFSDVSAAEAELDARTTRTDLGPDEGLLDLGFHYAPFRPRAAGDCNGDWRVTIAEIVRAVRIALRRSPVEDCPNADVNEDGSVAINELLQAVRQALYG
jgi:parallel beta-helix repeat protein